MAEWKGPGEIVDIKDTNAKVKIKHKIKEINGAKLKHILHKEKSHESIPFNHDELDLNQKFNDGPVTVVQLGLKLPKQIDSENDGEECTYALIACMHKCPCTQETIVAKYNQVINRSLINTITESLCESFLKLANKLLSSDSAKFEDLTPNSNNCGLTLKLMISTDS